MKKQWFLMPLVASVLLAVSCQKVDRNPLMAKFDTPFETPAYSQIKNEHYLPAFIAYIDKAKKEVDAIVQNKETPNFKNTIEALEFTGSDLSRVSGIFFNLSSSETNDTIQSIETQVVPMLTDYQNSIFLNEGLFNRVKSVYDSRADLALSPIEMRLTEETYKSFSRKGAALSAEDKLKYAEYAKELSNLSVKFDQNSLAATNAFTLTIIDTADLEALPEFVKDMAKMEAKQRGVEGWVFTLQSPSYGAFMTYSPKRELKEKFWRASNTKCIGGEYDNTAIVKRMVTIRLEVAKLLGYPSYSAYILENNMAKTPEAVNMFLDKLLKASTPYAKRDLEQVKAFAKKQGATFEIMPWDFGYYSDKLMNEKYAINDELLKPYFRLENVEKGVFDLANKLYGITFVPNDKIEKYNKDVNIYEVYDKDGKFLAVLYTDYFPRATKGGGAWMNSIREQKIVDGVETRPLITINGNFSAPTETSPSLLTFDEVKTLLHEFGHALHGIFSTGKYSSLAGTNVSRDFVELPSQIMENWASEREFLSMFAKHYITGDTISNEIVDKVVASNNYQAGYLSMRQLSFGMLDMAWHNLNEPFDGDMIAFEKRATALTQVLPKIDNTASSTSFGHIFSGGYASGYYSYKWAEVLEADAFMAFKERGIFNKDVATSFRDNILSQGCSQDPMALYLKFRGREPQVESLIQKLGAQ